MVLFQDIESEKCRRSICACEHYQCWRVQLSFGFHGLLGLREHVAVLQIRLVQTGNDVRGETSTQFQDSVGFTEHDVVCVLHTVHDTRSPEFDWKNASERVGS